MSFLNSTFMFLGNDSLTSTQVSLLLKNCPSKEVFKVAIPFWAERSSFNLSMLIPLAFAVIEASILSDLGFVEISILPLRLSNVNVLTSVADSSSCCSFVLLSEFEQPVSIRVINIQNLIHLFSMYFPPVFNKKFKRHLFYEYGVCNSMHDEYMN